MADTGNAKAGKGACRRCAAQQHHIHRQDSLPAQRADAVGIDQSGGEEATGAGRRIGLRAFQCGRQQGRMAGAVALAQEQVGPGVDEKRYPGLLRRLSDGGDAGGLRGDVVKTVAAHDAILDIHADGAGPDQAPRRSCHLFRRRAVGALEVDGHRHRDSLGDPLHEGQQQDQTSQSESADILPQPALQAYSPDATKV